MELRKSKKLFKILLGGFILFIFWIPNAQARLFFNTENNGTVEEVFYIDNDETTTDFIDLAFGSGVSARFRYDTLNSKFQLTGNLDMLNNQLQNFRVEHLSTPPTCDSNSAGRIYHNTTDGFSYVCNGAEWNPIDEDVEATLSGVIGSDFTLDLEDAGGDVIINFGPSEYLKWDSVNQWFVLSDDLNIEGNQFIDFRIENRNASAPACDTINDLGKQYYEKADGNAYVCIEATPGSGVYEWFDFTATFTTTATKVVTVGTGGNYATIDNAAGYLSGLTGGIILLTAEAHNVVNLVDLENITLIGANTGDTVINISGNGRLQVKETQFKSLTLNVDSAITASAGLDAKFDSTTTSSVIFEWVDFQVGGTKFLMDSTAGTPPVVRTRFISTSATIGNRQILPSIASSNLDATSNHFVESQGGEGVLHFQDWDVTIAGSGNVFTSGIITTIPENTIYIYPGMNIQAAIDSLPGGGYITILPGIHAITTPITITNESIELVGYGDASIIRATTGFAGATDTTAAIQLGTSDGMSPVNDVVLKDFELQVGNLPIHGIRTAGGDDLQLYNVSVIKTAGQGGTGATARMGIQFMDGSTAQLVRPVIKNCRVFGTPSVNAYFTDGIHLTGGTDYNFAGIWMNGAGIINALVEGNNVDYVRETVAVFIGVNDSSLFNNRFSRMGVGGGNSFGIFMGNSQRVNMVSNVISGSLATGSFAVGIDSVASANPVRFSESVIANNTIDGTATGGVGFGTAFQIGVVSPNVGVHRNIFLGNTISGASNATTTAFAIRGEADENNFSNNTITGGINPWDTGFHIQNSTADNNLIQGSKFINVTMNVNDTGSGTKRGVEQHQSTTDPTVNNDGNNGYGRGTIWINTTTNTAFISTNDTTGAAVWESIDGGGGSTDPIVKTDLAVVQARRTTHFTLTDASVWYDIDLDTTDVENTPVVLAHHSTNRDNIDIKENGIYQITYHISANDVASHQLESRVRLNDMSVIHGSYLVNVNYGNEYAPTSAIFIANLSAGDFITLQALRTTANEIIGETLLTITKLEGIKGDSATSPTGTDSEIFTIDQDDTGGSLALQFGSTLAKFLQWDNINTRFTFTDDVRVEGNLATVGMGYTAGDHTASESDGVLNLGRKGGLWQTLTFDSSADNRFEFGNDLSLEGNELQNFKIENLATAPTCDSGNQGRQYFNTIDSNLYICNGSAWQNAGAGSTTLDGLTDTSITTPAVGDMLTYNGATWNNTALNSGNDSIFHAYDAGGGVTITTVWTDVPFDTEVRKDADYTHATDSAEVTIESDGYYEIDFECSARVSDGTRSHADWRLVLNGLEVGGSKSYTYHRDSADGMNTSSIHRLLNLISGDVIKFQGQSDRTTQVTTVPDGCRISILKKDNTSGFVGPQGPPGTPADFLEGGEAGGADRTLGNTDNFDLGLLTNNQNRLHIQNDGNVGIGTTTPGAQLEITSDTADAFRINPYGTGAGQTGEMQFQELVANGTDHVGIKAPDTLTGNVTLTLPETTGITNQVLQTDGTGKLSWANLPVVPTLPVIDRGTTGALNAGTVTVNFTKTFSAPPTVVFSPNSNFDYSNRDMWPYVSNVTTTGFTITASTTYNGATFYWMAIGS